MSLQWLLQARSSGYSSVTELVEGTEFGGKFLEEVLPNSEGQREKRGCEVITNYQLRISQSDVRDTQRSP
ncbi:hypothetical protein DIT68_11780 [Brumimicrobium oceani]|uniref:Uncharacterized protein n=1 Tax=Brumimicrobium oceani TaxID=2100725 RepID=A0A2U2XB70_9FLAO|nr:hypothetical protein DIT68_11780 [Brumimicrobium oceani]